MAYRLTRGRVADECATAYVSASVYRLSQVNRESGSETPSPTTNKDNNPFRCYSQMEQDLDFTLLTRKVTRKVI